ncbi:2-keto-4-pentenoate hydratase/2-oxohepta-3-ene-1,7-dioic acid hydratase (catechol pathway) [Kytococcus aerolatus]|uniref:2-keto-4-pentenoate hydratase/2-oxohepta-3-ene-1,7-dioic acid hydratase (Catechol pathway) n=1 Tax=Kytococcus aerolatus TaxID=592308 RepID=A0A212U0Y2_9MICO|nr:fumarylacetoacetate hydrolase family protein [Kytococcus aerolatus]SNC71902.1 2-keto-4-pentenoate hydratase/2-oxohepta-3-ene-1,7-dioic acid hydratase (catechol pathway) [Kytococcus aerolatus]
MRICRFTDDSDEPRFGLMDGEGAKIAEITGDPLYMPIELTGATLATEDVRLLSPVIPRSKVIGVRRNYADHAAELGNEVDAEPGLFLVPNTAVCGPGDPVVIPSFAREISYEGELAVIIGRMCKDVEPEDARSVTFGYTCANDVTARDLQKADGQWARAKGMDTFCPLGPWIETELETADLVVRTRLDGEIVQDGRTADMVFDVPRIISHVSKAFTLLPGDVILTGTPAGVGPVTAGQRVEVSIQGIGRLANPFVDAEA